MIHDPKDPALIAQMAADPAVQKLVRELFNASCRYRYGYNFSWLGRPIIQYPEDLMALQELIWSVKPELIIETGIAHGGSLIFHASMLELLGGPRRVVGIDIDIRPHNREAIQNHPLFPRITLVQGSSVDPAIVQQVRDLARGRKPVMVVLDSNHASDHVLQELELYSPLVTKGSYVVVLDTVVEKMPPEFFQDRPWGPGNSPLTAVQSFLARNRRFQMDREVEGKLLLSVAPQGFLKCTEDPGP